MGYSPWGRKESDMTEQLHSLILMCGLPGWLSGKESPAMQEPQEIQVQSLYWEDPLEKKMATHSKILAWRIPLTEESGGQQSMGMQSSWTHSVTQQQ